MVNYLIQPPKINIFVRLLFYLLMAVVTTILLVVLFFKINDTVIVKDGELFSRNAPVQYNATYDAEIQKISVNEGDQVAIGDTLILLKNDELLAEYAKIKEAYFLQQMNLNLDQKELINRENKLQQLNHHKQLAFAKNKYNQKNSTIELQSAEEQIKALKEKLTLGESRLKKDFQLYKDGALSQLDYENNRRKHLDEINELESARKNYQLQLAAQSDYKNQFNENLQQIRFQWINLEQEIIEQKKLIFEKETAIQNLAIQMDFLANEIRKLCIKSTINGTITSVFHEKQLIKNIQKGQNLITIKPQEAEVFYARLKIPQKSISKIKKGQTIHLKLEAYNYLQHGIVKGKIENIHQKDTTQNFFVLARLNEVPSNFVLQTGYKAKGSIILEQMKLYQYIARQMFEKIA